MKNKKRVVQFHKFIRPIAILLVMVFLMIYASVAWIKRDWTPYLYSGDGGIKIATSGSLVFDMNDTATSSKTLNELLGEETFELKPVSNATGRAEDFYKLDDAGKEEAYAFERIVGSGSDIETGKRNGYIDLYFNIKSDDTAKYIYLHEDSYIGPAPDEEGRPLKAAEKAIRVAIQFGTSDPLLFSAEGSDRAKNTNGEQQTYNAVKAPGLLYTKSPNGEFIKNEAVINKTCNFVKMSEYNGYSKDASGETVKDPARCLGVISPETEATSDTYTTVRITVRIWLEGEDEYCNESIIAEELDILIKFAAYDAPDAAEA